MGEGNPSQKKTRVMSTRRRVPTNWVSGRTLQPSIESVVANSFVPSDFLVDSQVSGLGTVHPLLTLSFFSTWILPLHVVLECHSLTMNTIVLQLSDAVADISMLQCFVQFRILIINAHFVVDNATHALASSATARPTFNVEEEDVVIRNGWTPKDYHILCHDIRYYKASSLFHKVMYTTCTCM